MATQSWLVILAAAIMVMQFLYRWWDKKDNEQLLKAISQGIASFEPHVERTKQTNGIVKALKALHDVHDDDGRPLIYMPKEIIETQREMVKLTHKMAMIQGQQVHLLERMDQKIDDHKAECKNQFTQLDKKTEGLAGGGQPSS